MAWTKERVELLKKLWAEGLSCSLIADRMGGYLTRNAVIGKVSRLGLPGRDVKVRQSIGGKKGAKVMRKRHQEAKRVASGKPTTLVETVFRDDPFVPGEDLHIPVKERKTLLQLEDRDCRWPIGDPKEADFHFCGKAKVTGLPYCPFHVRRAFAPPKPARPPGTPANQLRLVADNDSGSGAGVGAKETEIATSGAVKAKETV